MQKMTRRTDTRWATEMDQFFAKQGPVWETLRALEGRLQDARLDYVIIGGMALNAHGYARQTVDVDVVLTPEGWAEFQRTLRGPVYRAMVRPVRRSRDIATDVDVDVLVAGEIAGNRSKNKSVRFPHPSNAEEHGGLRTVSLAKLIELKLVTWRYKDWGDVVELIRRHGLGEDFGLQLDPSIRLAYGECFDQANEADYDGPG
jgi:hypothetical protein